MTCATSDVFVDTNVFVHAVDPRDPRKRDVAKRAILGLALSRRGVISSQVVSECACALCGKLARLTSPERLDRFVAAMSSEFVSNPITPDTVRLALRAKQRWGLHFYDAQIWAAASEAEATILLSEDFGGAATLGRIKVLDPFAEGFDFSLLD